jgi:hypothetical protein
LQQAGKRLSRLGESPLAVWGNPAGFAASATACGALTVGCAGI